MAQNETHQRKTSAPATGVRRAGTLLLLITFGALALAPQGGFVLCWSEDGHLAIEPQHAESEHRCDQDAHDDDARHDCEAPSDCCAHSQDTLAGASECECTDVPLLDLTVALSGSKLKLLLSAALQRATAPTIDSDLARGASPAGRYDSSQRAAHIASQRPELIRSVFLRL